MSLLVHLLYISFAKCVMGEVMNMNRGNKTQKWVNDVTVLRV